MKSKKLPGVLFGHSLLLVAGILFMFAVNSHAPVPTKAFLPERCTRYCHDHGCPHLEPVWIKEVVTAQMYWLKNNPLGMDYRTINMLLYVFVFPGLALFLSVRLFLKLR